MAVTVITGGAGHLGQALVARAVARGDETHIVDVSPRVTDIAASLGATGHRVDMTNADEVATLAVLPRVDRLICGVGAWPRIPWTELTPERWNSLVSLNLTSAFLAVSTLTKALMSASGSVVLVGSAIALKGNPEMAHYAAAKAGLIGMAKSLALSLGPAGVRVNVVAPGLIETPDADHTWTLEDRQKMWNQRALRRALTVDEVADPIDFLSGALSSGITGQTLVVDGGIVLH